MKTLFISLTLLLYSSNIFSQWIIQNSPTTASLQDVHFESSDLGWAVGGSDFFPQSSVILITTDAGSNWSAQVSPVTRQLNAVSFVSSSKGWAVGNGGKIIVTANGGANWSEQVSGTANDLFDLFFFNNLKGWAVGDGGKILLTTDGGLIWQSRNSGTTDPLWSVWFSDENTGWAVGGNIAFGNSRILKTTNGGNNWTAQSEPTGKMFSDLSFADANTGWAVSETGTLINTINGGANWATQNSGTAVEWLYAVYAISNQLAWVGGGGGYLASTINGGSDWTQSNSGITQAIRGLYFVDANSGWAVGDEGKILKYTPASLVLTSPNGEQSWKSGTNQNITWNSNGIANIKIEYSADNGTNWNLVTASTPAASGNYIWTVPNNPTTQAKVRISNTANLGMNDISDNVFTIYTPSISVLSPNGGEKLKIGSQTNITWISTGISKVVLKFRTSEMPPDTWNIISTVNAHLGLYSWTIPNKQSKQCLLRIEDEDDNSVSDQSDAFFEIFGNPIADFSVNKLNPNCNEQIIFDASSSSHSDPDHGIVKYEWDFNVAQAAIPNQDTSQIKNNFAAETLGIIVNHSYPAGAFYPVLKITDDQGKIVFSWGKKIVANPLVELVVGSKPALNFIQGNPNPLPKENFPVGEFVINPLCDGGELDEVTISLSGNTGNLTGPLPFRLYASETNIFEDAQAIGSDAGELLGKVKFTGLAEPILNAKYFWLTADLSAAFSGLLKGAINQKEDLTFNNGGTVSGSSQFGALDRVTIDLQLPNGGETWAVGSNQNITWNSSGIEKVKLEFSHDNGASWVLIENNVAGNLSAYLWTIPNSPSLNCKVRISDAANNLISDESQNKFKITKEEITIIAPNGGENWLVSNQYEIKWDPASVANVKIEYSHDDGITWAVIVENIASVPSSYNWTPINPTSKKCLVRIVDANNEAIYGISKNNFIISVPPVSSYSINSNSLFCDEQVSYDASGSYHPSPIFNIVRYDWDFNHPEAGKPVPDLSEIEKNFVSDRGGADDKIFIHLFSPGIYNTVLRVLDDAGNYAYSWKKIEIKTKVSFYPGSDASLNYMQKKPEAIPINNHPLGMFKIVDECDNTILEEITLKIIGNFGQLLGAFPFRLYSSNVNNFIGAAEIGVDAALVGDKVKLTNLNDIINVEKYYWITADLNMADPQLLRAEFENANNIKLNNNGVISNNKLGFLDKASSIAIIAPNGGEVINSGKNYFIRWNSTNVDYVKIEYSLDNGFSWITITNSTAASAENYLWQPPFNSTTQALIKITDTSNNSIFDQSDNSFTIQIRSLNLTSPNGGENWKVGTTQNIAWVSQNLDLINLEYSIDNKIQWTTIISSIPANSGSYNWVVPNQESDLVFIRVSDASDLNLFDINDTQFKIEVLRKITVTYPNGGEVMQKGKTNTITWTSENIDQVKIEYYDFNNNWIEIASGIDAAVGKFDWQIPEEISINGKIRIVSMNNPLINDENDASFGTRILKIISPNGGERWGWLTSQKIEWYDSDKNRSGKLIEYSSDNGVTWNFKAAYQGETNDLYQSQVKSVNWMPSSNASTQYKVRITDRFHTNLTDESDATFEIFTQPIILSYPNGGEEFLDRETINITFIVQENIKMVNILYTTDNGINWNEIISNYDLSDPTPFNLKEYQWKAPRIYSNNFKIQIVDAENELLNDISDNTFKISERKVQIIYPIGTEIYSPSELYSTGGFTLGRSNLVMVKVKVLDRSARVNWGYWTCNRQYEVSGQQVDSNGEINFGLVVDECHIGNMGVSVWHAWREDYPEERDVVSVLVKPHPFKITSPSFREVIIAEKSFTIKWDLVDPEVEKIKIELYTPSHGIIELVDNYPAESGEFIWNVPKSLIGINNARLQISDASMPTYYKSVFELSIAFGREIVIESPTNNQVVFGGSVVPIKWTSLNVSNVIITYGPFINSDNEIATVNSATSPIYSGNFNWTVPDVRSGFYVLRISDIDNPDTYKYKSITIKNPKVSLREIQSILFVGDHINIYWNTDDLVQKVKISYSIDAGSTWTSIGNFSNLTLNGNDQHRGSCDWIVPEQITQNLIFRAEADNDANVFCHSNLLQIKYPELSFTSPANGARFKKGETVRFEWREEGYQIGSFERFRLELSTDNGSTWWLTNADLSFSSRFHLWQVPSLLKETKYLFRITLNKPNLTYRDNLVEIIVEPVERRVILSDEWKTPLNIIEGSAPVQIVNELDIGSRENTRVKEAIFRVHADSEPDSIKRKFKLTYERVTSFAHFQYLERDGLQLRLVYSPGVASITTNFLRGIKLQYLGDPYKLDGVPACSISLVLIDEDSSNVLSRDLTFTSVNSAPVISDNNSPINLKYYIGQAPLNLLPNLSINDDRNLRLTAALELKVSENHSSDEDILGNQNSPNITSEFLQQQGRLKIIENGKAPQELIKLAQKGIYYLTDGGTRSINKRKRIDIQYFDDYNEGSNILTKYVEVLAPGTTATNLTPPVDLRIEYIFGGQIKVSWKDPSGKANGFIVYRTSLRISLHVSPTTNFADEEAIAVIGADQNEFIDQTTQEGYTYTYRVASFNEVGISDLSLQKPLTANYAIKPPTNLKYKINSLNGIELQWDDNSSLEDGFLIEVRITTGAHFAEIQRTKKDENFAVVKNLEYNKKYFFRIKAYSKNLFSEESNEIEVMLTPTDIELEKFLPKEFLLSQNYPNPFNPETIISYHIAKISNVNLIVYDLLGRNVAQLVDNEEQYPGIYNVKFIMNDELNRLSNGVYFYRLQAGEFVSVKKMILMK